MITLFEFSNSYSKYPRSLNLGGRKDCWISAEEDCVEVEALSCTSAAHVDDFAVVAVAVAFRVVFAGGFESLAFSVFLS